MICKGCEAHGEYGRRAGFTSIVINGEMGCLDADRVMDAFHFNQVKDKTVAGMTVYPSGKDHKRRHISRADNIRAMSDEELAVWLENLGICPQFDSELCSNLNGCPKAEEDSCWLKWLKKEADNG